jgi:hypothetical protein
MSPSTLLKTVGWMKYPLSPCLPPPVCSFAPCFSPVPIISRILENCSSETFNEVYIMEGLRILNADPNILLQPLLHTKVNHVSLPIISRILNSSSDTFNHEGPPFSRGGALLYSTLSFTSVGFRVQEVLPCIHIIRQKIDPCRILWSRHTIPWKPPLICASYWFQEWHRGIRETCREAGVSQCYYTLGSPV